MNFLHPVRSNADEENWRALERRWGYPPVFLVAKLPPAAQVRGMIAFVPDGGAGAVFRGSDGTNWVNLG